MQESLYYLFEIHIHRIYVDINLPCNLQVRWKKGKNESKSKHLKIANSIQYIDVDQTISIEARCRTSNGKFIPQEAKVQVLLFPLHVNSAKVAGQIQKYDLTQALSYEHRRDNTQKQFQVPLNKSTKNARIIFTIYAQYLRDGSNDDNSFTELNNTSNHMTFRPQSEHRRNSRQKDQYEEDVKSPLQNLPPKAERYENREDRATSNKQSRYVRQNRQNTRQSQRLETRNQQSYSRVEQPMGFSFGPQSNSNPNAQKQLKELLANFNQVNQQLIEKKQQCQQLQKALRAAQKQRGGIDDKKLQLINQLNSSITQSDNLKKEKGQLANQLSRLKEDLSRVKEDHRELQAHYSQLKEENKDLISNFNRLRDEHSRKNAAQTEQLEDKRLQINDLKQQIDKAIREKEDIKNDLFRKQSELISNENHLEQIKNQYLNKSVPIMEQLKKVNQDLGRQRSQLEKQLESVREELKYEKSLQGETGQRANQAFEELERQREKVKKLVVAFETKDKENKSNLNAIEQEMQHFFVQKDHELKEKDKELKEKEEQLRKFQRQLKEKDEQLSSLEQVIRQKDTALSEKQRQLNQIRGLLEQQSHKLQQQSQMNQFTGRQFESSQIQISQLKVKIKHLEEAYSNLEKDYDEKIKQCQEKAQFIDKVRQYVSKIETDNQEKDLAIKDRDEFIAKAKQFITTREKQLLTEVEKLKSQGVGTSNQEITKLNSQISKLRNEVSSMNMQTGKREGFVAELVQENNMLQQKIDQAQGETEQAQRRAGQLQEYIADMHERMEGLQEEIEQLVRKVRSQEQTLSQLVKNKLDMEIQLNLRTFQLQRMRQH